MQTSYLDNTLNLDVNHLDEPKQIKNSQNTIQDILEEIDKEDQNESNDFTVKSKQSLNHKSLPTLTKLKLKNQSLQSVDGSQQTKIPTLPTFIANQIDAFENTGYKDIKQNHGVRIIEGLTDRKFPVKVHHPKGRLSINYSHSDEFGMSQSNTNGPRFNHLPQVMTERHERNDAINPSQEYQSMGRQQLSQLKHKSTEQRRYSNFLNSELQSDVSQQEEASTNRKRGYTDQPMSLIDVQKLVSNPKYDKDLLPAHIRYQIENKVKVPKPRLKLPLINDNSPKGNSIMIPETYSTKDSNKRKYNFDENSPKIIQNSSQQYDSLGQSGFLRKNDRKYDFSGSPSNSSGAGASLFDFQKSKREISSKSSVFRMAAQSNLQRSNVTEGMTFSSQVY